MYWPITKLIKNVVYKTTLDFCKASQYLSQILQKFECKFVNIKFSNDYPLSRFRSNMYRKINQILWWMFEVPAVGNFEIQLNLLYFWNPTKFRKKASTYKIGDIIVIVKYQVTKLCKCSTERHRSFSRQTYYFLYIFKTYARKKHKSFLFKVQNVFSFNLVF